ncbi:MAG: 50S ribosomal protein L25 [Anaerolineales bacterium]
MDKVVIKATKREVTGKQVSALRRAGQLPAVIYGRHVEPIAISLDAHTASLAMAKLTSSSLVTIELDGKQYSTLVRERQRNFIKGNLTHVDFLAVNLDEKIRATVRVNFVGVSLAVKDFNAVLVRNLEKLEVECLPTDLPERITVDISALKQIGNGIRVRDVGLSDNIRVLNDEDEMVVVATAERKEEVEEVVETAAVPAAEAASPEISVDRGKKDEEGAEK